MAEAPYQQSRAALRREFGSRTIDARSRQSPLDTTPSGKFARLREMGIPEKKVLALYNQEFRKQFEGSTTVVPPPQLKSRVAIQNPVQKPFMQGGIATPQDIQRVRATGAASGSFQTPYGPVSFGLLPETGPAESFAPFTPSAPLTSFALPKPTVLSNGSKWNKPVFG